MSFLKHNWFLKLLALGIAVMLAAYVRTQRGPDDAERSTLLLPLNLAAPAGQKVAEPIAGLPIRVELEGPPAQVGAVTNEDVKLNVDITRVKPGKRTPVAVGVELPEKYHQVMLNWRPRSVQVLLVSDATRQFSVSLKPLSQPEGWEWKDYPRTNPATVSVSGTAAAVERVASVAAPFTLERSERINTLATLQALDANGNNITRDVTIEPALVQVTALQEPVVREKRVPVQPLFELPPGARVTVQGVVPSRVRLMGPDRAVSQIYVVETDRIEIPVGGTAVDREVTLVSPDDRVKMIPARVRVTLKVEPQAAKPGAGGETEPSR
jgi:YbbR domain-containing protein